MKQGVMQFVLIKPITSIFSVILFEFGLYKEGDFSPSRGYIYLSIINNISISISLYCLVLFYIAFEKKLEPFRPFSKFLCIKFVLFFSFWQSCFLNVMSKMQIFSIRNSKFLQDGLICFEMVFAAIAHNFAFSYTDFTDYSKMQKTIFKNLGRVLDVKDLIDDAEKTFIKKEEKEDVQLVDIRKIENEGLDFDSPLIE